MNLRPMLFVNASLLAASGSGTASCLAPATTVVRAAAASTDASMIGVLVLASAGGI